MWTYAVSAAYLLIGLMVKKTAGSYEHFVQPWVARGFKPLIWQPLRRI